MADILTKSSAKKPTLHFKAQIKNGVIVPTETITLPPDQTYVVTLHPVTGPDEASSLDALAEIAAMAQPLGPADLAEKFDTYTGRVISDESAT